MSNYRWGIIGPGKIAKKFADTINYVEGATLHAVASRDLDKAKTFAETHGAKKFYGSYEELASDPEIDAVYIATPHPFHCKQTILCLDHKKAVLCEKPMALSEKEVREMQEAAKRNNCFLMEAMWSRFLPATLKVEELVNKGKIGTIKYVRADFGFSAPLDLDGRLYNMNLGGGSLLDIGVYNLFLCQFLLGEPKQIKSMAKLADSGADINCQTMFTYADGSIAQTTSMIDCQLPITAEIAGTEGIIYMHKPWYRTEKIALHQKDGEPIDYFLPHEHNGFEYQVREVMNCLDNGLIESSAMPHEFTLALSKTMDTIRAQCGIVYPLG
jgi:predicted dehydrogenase